MSATNGQLVHINRVDAENWYSARTLADLGELTAQWLEGTLGFHPGYRHNGGPDEESLDLLIPTLAAVNRAGYLTHESQLGGRFVNDDEEFWQPAAVSGWAEPPMQARLIAMATQADLEVKTCRPAPTGPSEPRFLSGVATRFRGQLTTWLGGRSDVPFVNGCHPVAAAAVLGTDQVTVLDHSGRNDVLWSVLDQVSGRCET